MLDLVRGTILDDNLFRPLLCHVLQEQYIRITDTHQVTANKGLPQGFAVSPRLWNVYLNEVFKNCQFT
jgi:hypothetical protein